MKRFHILVLGVLLAGGCISSDHGGWRPFWWGQVTVESTDFMGWTNSWKLSNQSCEMIIVPAINHVMSFSLKGGSNLLWIADDVNGRVVQEPGVKWHNFGGDKVWPTAMPLWKPLMGRRWPPSYAFDGGRATAEPIPNGVRMISPEDPDFKAVCVREFVMDSRKPLVTIHQYFEKRSGVAMDMSFWTVTQVRRPTVCLLPLGREENGLRYRKLDNLEPGSFAVHNDVVSLKNDEKVCQKMGVTPDLSLSSGWVAACFQEDGALFLQSHQLQAGVAYPDNGCDAEVFASNREFGLYCEIELLGPLLALAPGQRYTHDVVWQLIPFDPGIPCDADQLGRTASEAHRLALKRLKASAGSHARP